MHDPIRIHTFSRATADGALTLRYRDDGAGEPLLLVHGFFGSGADFDHLPGLGAGMRRLRPDLRGHGGSFNPRHPFSFHEAARDLLELLRQLGVGPCHALGLSGGALGLLRLALLAPDALRSLVLVSACAGFPPEARRFMRAHVDAARSAASTDQAHRALLATADEFARGHDDASISPAELASIRTPILLVSGERDPLYPLETAQHLLRGLPNAALWVVPGEGHTPVFAAARDEFVRRAQAFFHQH